MNLQQESGGHQNFYFSCSK